MKLIYLWVEKYRSIEKQGFSFSEDFNVTYNFMPNQTQNLIIKRVSNNPNLFGNKITNISAIIGENGSGKTNLLDLLGFHIDDRFQNATQSSCYFMVYHIEGDQFVIEGNGFEKLGLIHVSERVLSLFSMVVKLEESGVLTFLRFLQEGKEESLAVYVNLRNQFNKEYWTSRAFMLEKDPYYLFFRYAISYNNTGIFTKYKFIRDFISILNTHSLKQVFQVSHETSITIEPRYNKAGEVKAKLKYNGFEEISLSDYMKNLQPDTMSPKDRKVYFIRTFIENTIHNLYKECIEVEDKKLQDKIDKVRLRKGNPINYLLRVLKVVGEAWDQIINLDRKFFDCFKEMYDFLLKLPEAVFRKQSIVINVYDPETKEILAFLQYLENSKLDSNNPVNSSLYFNIKPLSSGEEAFLTLFSSLHFAINAVLNAENTTCILLLDEPDAFMHPEWSRIMINQIVTYLEGTVKGYKDYQIIFTTHSPFIISDLPRKNLIALKKDRLTGKSLAVSLEGFPETFASNIHTLLSNEFFMEDTMGEFAKQKVTGIIKRLTKVISGEENLDPEYLNYEKIDINKWINIIGEPIIKTKLLQLFKQAFPPDPREKREERIQVLRDELNKLEKELEDEL